MAHTYPKLSGVHPLPGLKDKRIRALVLNCFTSGLHSAVFSIYLLIRLQVEKVFGLQAPRNSFRALHRAPKNHPFGPDMLFGWRESKWSKITDLHIRNNLMRKYLPVLELPAWDQEPDILTTRSLCFLT